MERKIKIKGKGILSICTGGKSKDLPFCDDSHREINDREGSSYKSLKIENVGDDEVDLNLRSSNWGD